VHCDSINESLKANLEALQFNPDSVELIDHYILDCTKENIEQNKTDSLYKEPQSDFGG
jgi:hypothetical protein